MLKIRLRRMGKRHRPFYRVVVSDSRAVPGAPAVEEIGHYDPMNHPQVALDLGRIEHWVGQGAQMSPTVKKLVKGVRTGKTEKAPEPETKKGKQAAAPEPEAAPAEETPKAEEAVAAEAEASAEEVAPAEAAAEEALAPEAPEAEEPAGDAPEAETEAEKATEA